MPPDPLPADPLAFLAAAGEMGQRTREFDWSATPLGPAAGWPQCLKTVVRIMLDSRYAMWLGWGPDFTFFYNDAYASMTLGPKHPWALGKTAREVWSEIWQDIGPRAESVVRTGRATWDEGLLLFLERRGFPEETYHTFSYSPVPGDDGGVGGMLCVVTEDTERTIGERRLRALRELAARTTEEARSVEDACRTAVLTLANSPRDLPFVLLYLLDDGRATLAGAVGLARDTPASPAVVHLADDAAVWPFRQSAQAGAVAIDLPARFGPLSGGAWPESPTRAVVLPLARPGQARPAGFVVAGVSPRLVLTDGYRGFLDLLAGHVGTAIANARAHEEERKRAESLAELDRAKTAFFSNVSHEFRTPLTLMLGPIDDLLSRSHTDLPPAAARQLDVVNRNGLRLLRLVNTLLDFSRIEAGRARAAFRATDLAAFTADLASVFRSACERAGLRLIVDCPPLGEPAFVDREAWEKVVLNLLSNAFKFTFDGEIVVTLRQSSPLPGVPGRGAGGEGASFAELRIRDTGTGIPAHETPRLFERFHRVENARGRTHEGSGIGLALVQELLKLHGGTIAADSVLGEGTTFIVRLPLGSAHLPAEQIVSGRSAAPHGTGAAPYVEEALRWLPDRAPNGATPEDRWAAEVLALTPATQPPADDDRPCILVADDNADMRQYVCRLLGEQYRVEAVADGKAALDAVRLRPPALVLSDVMMPKLDGFGLLQQLRADPQTREIPVILLSARAGEESRVEGMEAGADDYLVKPFGARELLARISGHVQMARMRREAAETLRRSERQMRLIADNAPVLIAHCDAEGRYKFVNRPYAARFGLTPAGVIGKCIPDVVGELAYASFRDKVAQTLAGTPVEFEVEIPYRAGAQFMHCAYVPEREGGQVVGLVAAIVNITERRRAEEALREADRRKDEFLATLAHELRNPLAPIRNGLQVIRLSDTREIREQAHAMMERQLGQMVRLIDDLMDVSRVSRGKVVLRKERVAFADVVRHAVETSRPLIEAHRHDLSLDLPAEPLYVEADVTRLAQVFANLLNNAAKYTPDGGRIRLAAHREGADVVASVSDNGAGIPAEMLPRVFEMFTQIDHTLERSQGGLGIGLSLVKRLVEMHGGSVEARSDGHGTGSEFVVRLPACAPPEKPATDAELAPTAVRRRILVVDDNEDAALSMAMMLGITGNDTRVAHDGIEAIEVAEAFRPNVILLGVGMPRLNGYDACRRIRSSSWSKGVVIVATTGWGQDEDRRRSRDAGFDVHLVKPVDPAELERLLGGLS